jgi:hypothetical protein
VRLLDRDGAPRVASVYAVDDVGDLDGGRAAECLTFNCEALTLGAITLLYEPSDSRATVGVDSNARGFAALIDSEASGCSPLAKTQLVSMDSVPAAVRQVHVRTTSTQRTCYQPSSYQCEQQCDHTIQQWYPFLQYNQDIFWQRSGGVQPVEARTADFGNEL